MQQLATRPWITAGIALAGASVIAVTPVTTPLPAVHVRDLQLTAAEEMVLDFVRHGQSLDNAAVPPIIGTVAPGPGLTLEGEIEARFLASSVNPQQLLSPESYDGIFASGLLRTQETASEWLGAAGVSPLGQHVTDLSGLNELNAGILEGVPQNDLTGLMYLAAPLLWTLGLFFVPELGSSDYNGMAFESAFSGAVQTIYNAGGPTSGGALHDVAFSSAAAIMIWTMMNVNNPDPLLIIEDPLANTGQVIVEGNPTDGWTLESWNGTPVAPASLPVELLVNVRDLIVAPQMAAYGIQEGLLNSLGTLSLTPLLTAIQAGVSEVVIATLDFPVVMIRDIIFAALGGSSPGELAALLPAAATDAAGALPGELSGLVGDIFTAI